LPVTWPELQFRKLFVRVGALSPTAVKGLKRFCNLPFHRRATPEFIEEVFQEDDVVLRLWSLHRHHGHDALAIGAEIDVLNDIDCVRQRLFGP
jgi:hypothetical protein